MSQILTYAYQFAAIILGIVVLLSPTLILPPVRNLVIERGLGTVIDAATRKTREADLQKLELQEKRQKVREAVTELASAVATFTSGIIGPRRIEASTKALTAIAVIRLYCSESDALNGLESQIANENLARDHGSYLVQQAILSINLSCLDFDTR